MKAACCANEKISAEIKDLSDFLKIISENNRLKILCLLRSGELCVCEIYKNLDLPQNLISNHLKVLKNFNLIDVRPEWKKNYYSINQRTFAKYNLLLTNFLKKYE